VCICKTILHFVSEHDSKEWRRSMLTLAKIAQNYLVTIATSLELLRNLCQFYNTHIYIYQHWNVCKDWFSSCWDIRRYRPSSVESQHNFHFAVAIHTAGWRTKNRYVNICIYVDSLQLLAATSPTAVVGRWQRAGLQCCGSGFESRYGEFFLFYIVFCFVIKFVFHFATFSLIQKNIKAM